MKLIDRRELTTTNGLSTGDTEQLEAIGTLYFGSPGSVTIDDDFEGADPIAARVLMTVDVWKVMEGGSHVYDVWTYMGDSGTVFRAGSAETVAEIIQGGLECSDETLASALDEAIYEAYNPPEEASQKQASKKAPASKTKAKPAAKSAKKTTAKKPAAKSGAKKSAAKKAATKKPAMKKPAAKKAAKKPRKKR
jgi:hypothetical protein